DLRNKDNENELYKKDDVKYVENRENNAKNKRNNTKNFKDNEDNFEILKLKRIILKY
ncbi:14896_t:CDS:1, partial [Dentiscutata erythropus]